MGLTGHYYVTGLLSVFAAAIFAVILLQNEILCSTLHIILFCPISGLIILHPGGQQCEGQSTGRGQVPHPPQVPADPGV